MRTAGAGTGAADVTWRGVLRCAGRRRRGRSAVYGEHYAAETGRGDHLHPVLSYPAIIKHLRKRSGLGFVAGNFERRSGCGAENS